DPAKGLFAPKLPSVPFVLSPISSRLRYGFEFPKALGLRALFPASSPDPNSRFGLSRFGVPKGFRSGRSPDRSNGLRGRLSPPSAPPKDRRAGRSSAVR